MHVYLQRSKKWSDILEHLGSKWAGVPALRERLHIFFRNERGALSANLLEGALHLTVSESLVSHPQYTAAVAAAEGTAFVSVFYRLQPMRKMAMNGAGQYSYPIPLHSLPPPPSMAMSLVLPAISCVGGQRSFSPPAGVLSAHTPSVHLPTPLPTLELELELEPGPLQAPEPATHEPVSSSASERIEQPTAYFDDCPSRLCRKDDETYDASLLDLLQNINETRHSIAVVNVNTAGNDGGIDTVGICTGGIAVLSSSGNPQPDVDPQDRAGQVTDEGQNTCTQDALEYLVDLLVQPTLPVGGRAVVPAVLEVGISKSRSEIKENIENLVTPVTVKSEDFRIFKFIEDQIKPGSSRRRRLSAKTADESNQIIVEQDSRAENSIFSLSLGTHDTEETSREISDEDDLGVSSDSHVCSPGSARRKRARCAGPDSCAGPKPESYVAQQEVVQASTVRVVFAKKRITPTFIAPLQDRLNFLSASSAFSQQSLSS